MSRFAGRRLSGVRLSILIAAVAALAFAGTSGWRHAQDSQAAGTSGDAWYGGYVDATVTPLHPFEQPSSTAARDVVLSFVVADADNACTPSWGAAYSLDAASADLDLDRRIARLRQQGGTVVVSFGGAVNAELSTACTDPTQLLAAYRRVVQRYDLRTIDLDIEGAALDDVAATARRAAAIKSLQDEQKKAGKGLRVWLTLPVSPDGLTVSGKRVVSSMLEGSVDLSGVNVMTMDYGASRAAGQSMLDASTAALTATHEQLGRLYADAGKDVGPATIWRRMGATPMIGQNDVAGEIFTLADARGLSRFARTNGLGRMSMWSLNRDRTCGDNYPDVTVVSNSCSGVDQKSASFAKVLRGKMTGSPDKNAVTPVVRGTAGNREDGGAGITDDPATSPYPIWDENQTYLEGTRVVWHRNAYVAKYWTLDDLPDDPVVETSASPWQLIGPVLPGEKPLPEPTLPRGTYPQWDREAVYRKGDRVMLGTTAFTAKWYSTGISPDAPATQGEPSPWRRLTDDEVKKAATAAKKTRKE